MELCSVGFVHRHSRCNCTRSALDWSKLNALRSIDTRARAGRSGDASIKCEAFSFLRVENGINYRRGEIYALKRDERSEKKKW